MAIITLNPILQSIHGKLGTIVFVRRNGTQFVRRHVIPHDPKTESQLKNRRIFAELVSNWQKLPSNFKDSWNRYGKTKERTGYNLFISENIKRMRSGISPELVKVKYLRKNKCTLLAVSRHYNKQLQLNRSISAKCLLFLNHGHPDYNREDFLLQRE